MRSREVGDGLCEIPRDLEVVSYGLAANEVFGVLWRCVCEGLHVVVVAQQYVNIVVYVNIILYMVHLVNPRWKNR